MRGGRGGGGGGRGKPIILFKAVVLCAAVLFSCCRHVSQLTFSTGDLAYFRYLFFFLDRVEHILGFLSPSWCTLIKRVTLN